MKKLLAFSFVLIVLCTISAYLFDWWFIAVVSAIISYWFSLSRWTAFITGFISIFLLWSILSYYMSIDSSSKIIDMVGSIFQNTTAIQLSLVSGLIGGITAGLGSWSGSSLKLFIKS
ncbi:MAG: hypothetical protein ABI851_07785 [Saprospiraceae bacterium]